MKSKTIIIYIFWFLVSPLGAQSLTLASPLGENQKGRAIHTQSSSAPLVESNLWIGLGVPLFLEAANHFYSFQTGYGCRNMWETSESNFNLSQPCGEDIMASDFQVEETETENMSFASCDGLSNDLDRLRCGSFNAYLNAYQNYDNLEEKYPELKRLYARDVFLAVLNNFNEIKVHPWPMDPDLDRVFCLATSNEKKIKTELVTAFTVNKSLAKPITVSPEIYLCRHFSSFEKGSQLELTLHEYAHTGYLYLHEFSLNADECAVTFIQGVLMKTMYKTTSVHNQLTKNCPNLPVGLFDSVPL